MIYLRTKGCDVMSTISSDTKFLGNGKWVNQDTGEMIEVNEVVKRVPRSGFEITYLTYFMDLFDKLGGQKYQVFKYIIENRSRDNNTLVTTNKELSRLTKTSTKTVQDTINLLKEAGLIERRMGAIMLNPKLVHRGSNQKEKYLLQRFEPFDQADSTEK